MTPEIAKLIELQQGVDEKDAYAAGFHCGRYGSDTQNCHFKYFSRPSLTKAWERGKREAESLK